MLFESTQVAVTNDPNKTENMSTEVTSAGALTADGLRNIRESLALAETLARASLMTSPAAKRRLKARALLDSGAIGDPAFDAYNGEEGYVPPRQLLLYLVRMGSFTSAPKILNDDCQDNDIDLPDRMSRLDLLNHCKKELSHLPPLVKRSFKTKDHFYDLSKGVLPINSVSQVCSEPVSGPENFRILQWNILSQSLGVMNDNFVCCPDEALDWSTRRYRIVEEIITYSPDVVCLQEVDHFNFLQKTLGTQGYRGMFFPKPDSPCLYINGNNGPDGCAIFYRENKYDLVRTESRILEVWCVQSNQVALSAILRVRETGQEICVSTTHLKAKNGALLSTLRNEQGKDLLDFVSRNSEDRPVILCGDFNAEPIEPVYMTVLRNRELGLASAYANIKPGYEKEISSSVEREPPYTTWKIREEGEVCHTIDYVFYTSDKMAVESVLEFPTGQEIGAARVPSFQYPSDHFSLVCDFRIYDEEKPNGKL